MNLNQLAYFYIVGKTGNYSRAAEELGVSQPVVYKSIRSLERTCGVKLVERRSNGLSLTKAGRSLYVYAAQASSLDDLADQALAEEKGPMSGHISVGTGTHVGCYLLPKVLAKWMGEHSRVTLSIIFGQHEHLGELLLEDRLDFLLASGSRWAPGLRSQFVFSDSLVVVARPNHPLEKSSVVSIKELSREPFVAPLPGGFIREEMKLIESQFETRFRIAVEVNRHDMIKQLCQTGVGVGVLPLSIVTDEIQNGELSLLHVEGFPRSRRYFLVQRVGKVLTPEMRSLLGAIESFVREESRVRSHESKKTCNPSTPVSI